ncbi:MAG: HPr kinase/phosphorylase [Gammaproteobacteria bacterium]|jgi:HPr kinase/phosphorylase
MTNTSTLGDLLDQHEQRLGLVGVETTLTRDTLLDIGASGTYTGSVVGYMNLIRPNQLQVLGKAEFDYLGSQSVDAAKQLTDHLLACQPGALIVADDLPVPRELIVACQEAGASLLRASAPSEQVVQELLYYLSRSAARRASIHGVFIEVMGVGVLLTGDPGVGKSELALELLTRGHRLIADDAPEFTRVTPETVEGSCPPALRDFMEVRGLGIVNVRALFGDSAVKPRRTLRLVIRLVVLDNRDYSPEERLQGIRGELEVLGIPLTEVSLPVAPGHNMAVLVECTVRNYILSMKGYDAAEDFAERQAAIMRGDVISEG